MKGTMFRRLQNCMDREYMGFPGYVIFLLCTVAVGCVLMLVLPQVILR